MSGFKSAWWFRGGHAPAIDKREIIGIVPMDPSLLGTMPNGSIVVMRGGGAVVQEGTVEHVTAQIFGQWPPDAPEEQDPAPTGTKQPLETLNVSGPALAADIEAAWREASSSEQSLPPDVDRAVYDGAIRTMVQFLCARLGIDVPEPRDGEARKG